MTPRGIVLDANVIIRGVLGTRVAALLLAHAGRVTLFVPDTACEEARRHLPDILGRCGQSLAGVQAASETLEALILGLRVVPAASYESQKRAALARIGDRDPDDWPVLACALLTGCPIWTEDQDFFGAGVATWSTALVELYFNETDSDLPEQ